MSIINFLHTIREEELNKAITEMAYLLKEGLHKPTLLEIGAGTGHQAKILSNRGFQVQAIDLPNSAYKNLREFEITEYNGKTLPCSLESVDIIFSSNVLEHIDDIDSFLKEIHRVGCKNGAIIHILPSSSWRFWSIVAYYPWTIKKVITKIIAPSPNTALISSLEAPVKINFLSYLFPQPHGERGNVLSEIYYFSEYWWKKKFIENNFYIKKTLPNDIFYTDASLFGSSISLSFRKTLARLLGSSCKIYILEKR